MHKKYKNLKIKPLIEKMGGCTVTNRIIEEGEQINFFYRETPLENRPDSGWRFFSGINEDDAYLDNPKNTQIFDVNTVANIDPDIIPFLNSPYHSAFERNSKTGKFEQVFDFEFPR